MGKQRLLAATASRRSFSTIIMPLVSQSTLDSSPVVASRTGLLVFIRSPEARQIKTKGGYNKLKDGSRVDDQTVCCRPFGILPLEIVASSPEESTNRVLDDLKDRIINNSHCQFS